jgi:hypothetical protein
MSLCKRVFVYELAIPLPATQNECQVVDAELHTISGGSIGQVTSHTAISYWMTVVSGCTWLYSDSLLQDYEREVLRCHHTDIHKQYQSSQGASKAHHHALR